MLEIEETRQRGHPKKLDWSVKTEKDGRDRDHWKMGQSGQVWVTC